MSDVARAQAWHRDRSRLFALIFGFGAAPGCWIGQILLGYATSSIYCYPGDHPLVAPPPDGIGMALLAFDVAAIVGAIAGGVVAFLCWRATSGERELDRAPPGTIGLSRARFMALWGMFSSLWFLYAIVFNAIGTAMVPLCNR